MCVCVMGQEAQAPEIGLEQRQYVVSRVYGWRTTVVSQVIRSGIAVD